jgi:RNA polymerase sigma factor (sigma-70 family)
VSGHELDVIAVDVDEGQLWFRVRSGDAQAFGVLFERHAKLIYNYCFRRIGDWTKAEDLVSIVFLEAWRNRARLLPDKGLPWLFGIASNVVRNQRRSERRYAVALRRISDIQQEPDFAPEAVARLDEESAVETVLANISTLPRREQEVFVLCASFDFSYEDVALALGIPVGTVRSRLSRARQRLRELETPSGHEGNRATPAPREALER